MVYLNAYYSGLKWALGFYRLTRLTFDFKWTGGIHNSAKKKNPTPPFPKTLPFFPAKLFLSRPSFTLLKVDFDAMRKGNLSRHPGNKQRRSHQKLIKTTAMMMTGWQDMHWTMAVAMAVPWPRTWCQAWPGTCRRTWQVHLRLVHTLK